MGLITSTNQVALNPEGYIEMKLIGEQTYQTIEEVGKASRQYIDKLNYEHRPVLVLIDLTQHKSINSGTNKASMELLDAIPYKRTAMFGSNAIITEVSRGIITALGKGENTKVFKTREEAVAWLVMKDPLAG
jgi:hypothetical protein